MILRWLDATTLAVETDRLTPEALLGLGPDGAARLPVRIGNRNGELGDLFSVRPSGSGAGDRLTLEGDLRHVRGVGRGMASGALTVRGRAGPFTGAGMTGGVLEIEGDAGDWAGAGMRGGLLRVRGSAGDWLGASFPGDRVGMREGVILVDGPAGDEVGRRMRRGLIAVGGSVGDRAGRGLVAGSIFAFGPVGRHPGAGMKRGTVAAFGGGPVDLLPSFAPAGCYRFPFLGLYLRRLASWGFPVPGEVFGCPMARYNGDLAGGGRGEVLLRPGPEER